jgi:hypothetical protein
MARFHLRNAVVEHSGGVQDRAEQAFFGIKALGQRTVGVGQIRSPALLIVGLFFAVLGIRVSVG